MKVEFEVWSEVIVWERNKVSMEVSSLNEAHKILEDNSTWLKHYDTIDSIELCFETLRDTNNYEVQRDTLEIVE